MPVTTDTILQRGFLLCWLTGGFWANTLLASVFTNRIRLIVTETLGRLSYTAEGGCDGRFLK